MQYKFIISLILLIFILPNILGADISLDLKSIPDSKENLFYISRTVNRNIYFSIDSNYLPNDILKKTKVIYNLYLYPETEIKNISIKLSKDYDQFVSNINSEFSLNISSNNFVNNIIKARVSAILYDEYGNLLDSDSRYITLVSNNSEIDVTYTPNRAEPKFFGYSFSRDKLFLFNKFDTDRITIKQYVGYPYSLDCKSNQSALLIDTEYIDNNDFNLSVKIDENIYLNKGNYKINCVAFNSLNTYKLKPLTVKYFAIESKINQDILIDDVKEEPSFSSLQNLLKNITSSLFK